MSSPAVKLTNTPAAKTSGEVAAPASNHEETARCAYSYWEARGCPDGSPDKDWFRAAEEIRRRQSGHLFAPALGLPH